MKRAFKTVTKLSIFTSRNNSTIQLLDRYEYVEITASELHRYGGSRDKDGKIWHLNSIVTDETGEYLRTPQIRK